MEYTAGEVWRDGKPVLDDYTYLSSMWATPVLEIDGEEIECWIEDEVNNSASIKWPKEALELL